MRVLLVEDDVFFLKTVSALLQRTGGPVDAAFSASKGLEFIRHQAYDVMITDLMMEGFNGADLIRVVLKERLIDARNILVMTAEEETSADYQWICNQDIQILKKPFTLAEFSAAVRTVSPAVVGA